MQQNMKMADILCLTNKIIWLCFVRKQSGPHFVVVGSCCCEEKFYLLSISSFRAHGTEKDLSSSAPMKKQTHTPAREYEDKNEL